MGLEKSTLMREQNPSDSPASGIERYPYQMLLVEKKMT